MGLGERLEVCTSKSDPLVYLALLLKWSPDLRRPHPLHHEYSRQSQGSKHIRFLMSGPNRQNVVLGVAYAELHYGSP